MGIEVTAVDGEALTTLRLTGELDIASAPQVEAALRRAEAQGKSILLDLSALEFIDSSGLRVVIAADRRARDLGVVLTLVQGPEPVRRVFRIAHLEERLNFAEDPDETT
jgi:anti-sigma B factor antagonist